MVLDVMMWSFLEDFKINLLYLLEWLLVFCYICCFLFIIFNGITKINEEIEFFFMGM